MSDEPNRRFWQIHLSTAIVLMFATGGMLWANTRIQISYETDSVFVRNSGRKPSRAEIITHGWPYEFYEYRSGEELRKLRAPPSYVGQSGEFWDKDAIFYDIVWAIGILFSILFIFQFRQIMIGSRRREGRKS